MNIFFYVTSKCYRYEASDLYKPFNPSSRAARYQARGAAEESVEHLPEGEAAQDMGEGSEGRRDEEDERAERARRPISEVMTREVVSLF